MHKAFQYGAGGVATVGFGVAEVITYRELTRPGTDYNESNPMLGSLGLRPAPMVGLAAFVNLAVVVGIQLIPDKLDAYAPWVKDTLAGTHAVLGAVDGYHDWSMTH